MYCPRCAIPFNGIDATAGDAKRAVAALGAPVPQFNLPAHITVLRNPNERSERSSAVQARVLCPDRVTLLDALALPAAPSWPANAAFVCMDRSAPLLAELPRERLPTHAVFIDSKWAGVHRYEHLVQTLPRVRLGEYRTLYWR